MMTLYDIIVVLGSDTDKKYLRETSEGSADKLLEKLNMTYQFSIISAHRHPQELQKYCVEMSNKVAVFIGIAGAFPALPGAIASALRFRRPVIGVYVGDDHAETVLATGKMANMPRGCPMCVMGPNHAGVENAILAAAQIISLYNEAVHLAFNEYSDKTISKKRVEIDFHL